MSAADPATDPTVAQLRAQIRELEEQVRQLQVDLQVATEQRRGDLNVRQQMEEELRRTAQNFREIVDAIPIPIAISRMVDGYLEYMNHSFCDLLEAPPEKLMSLKTRDYYADLADRDRLLQLLSQNGNVQNYELPIKLPTGERRWLEVSVQPIKYLDQDCLLAGLVDLTKRRDAEQSLQAERLLLLRLVELHERDRQLIGYEIHDGVVQHMTATLMFLESASDEVQARLGEAPESLSGGIQLLRDCVNEARRLITGLQPPVLDEAGVVVAIQSLAAEISAKGEMDIQLDLPENLGRLAAPLEMAVYRIVQECLTNVWQHSQATQARVALNRVGNAVQITVTDNGVGFDPTQVKTKRYGLVGIRERARLFGGEASIETAPGKGTRVHVELPLKYCEFPPTDPLRRSS